MKQANSDSPTLFHLLLSVNSHYQLSTYLAETTQSPPRPASVHSSSKLTMSSRSGTNLMALLQQCSPPERIIRMYPMALPARTGDTHTSTHMAHTCAQHDQASPTNLNDESPELVEVAESLRVDTELPNDLVESFSTCKWILEQKRKGKGKHTRKEKKRLPIYLHN